MIPLHHLREHRDSVESLAWSPDGKTLVTAAQKNLYIWNTEVRLSRNRNTSAEHPQTGEQKPTTSGQSQHFDNVSGIQWKPDGSEFLVSSMDCKLVFYVS